MSESVELSIGGMTCATCAARVEKALRAVPGVLKASVNAASEKAHVLAIGGVTEAALRQAVEAAGYELRGSTADAGEEAAARALAAERRDVVLAGIFSAPFLIGMIGMGFGQDWMPSGWAQFGLASFVEFWLGARFWRAGFKAWRAGAANMDLLVALGTTAGWALSVWLWLRAPQGAMVHLYSEGSALVITLVLLGKWLEVRSRYLNWVDGRLAQMVIATDITARLRAEEQAKLQDDIDAAGGWELDRKLEIAADALRLPPWEAKIENLSGGEKRRVALCRLLLAAPDMLLLDEPTNHLDAESIHWLEKYLEAYPSTVIAVTHDRYFLDNVAEWILELDRGHGIPYQGNYSTWLEQKEKRLAQEERERDALRKTLERELEWVRQNPKARQAKSKARMQRYEELASREFQERNETNEIYIPPGERLGDLVIEAKGLRKAFGDKLLFEDLNFNLPRGGIVGIIGPNGAGKTTLFRMLTGVEQPDSGEFRVGPSVKLAYVDQSRQALNDKNIVWQEISNGVDLIKVGNDVTPSRGYVGRFNFKGTQQQQLIGELSGGQRRRVFLARAIAADPEIYLLDEPVTGVDPTTQEKIMNILDAEAARGRTVVATTHDLACAAQRFHDVVALAGRVVAHGPAQLVLDQSVLEKTYGGHLVPLAGGGVVLLDDPHHSHGAHEGHE